MAFVQACIEALENIIEAQTGIESDIFALLGD